MKLRILGNSIRLRLSRSEVERVASEGRVEDSTTFATGATLVYRLEVSAGPDAAAALEGSLVRVEVPRTAVERWIEPDEVSIVADQALPGGDTLRILVEKDFECLSPRDDEDASDLFVNPGKAC